LLHSLYQVKTPAQELLLQAEGKSSCRATQWTEPITETPAEPRLVRVRLLREPSPH